MAAFVPDSLIGTCRINTAVEDCEDIIVAEALNVDTADLDLLKNRFDPQAAPLPLEFMPN